MPPNRIALEVCVDTVAGLAACAGIADRVELCAGLDIGGLTPGPGLLQAARDSGLETHVLIRPRPGDFSVDGDALRQMVRDIVAVRDMGLHGVVIGATKGGALDVPALRDMVQAAQGLNVTLHRAIDVVRDPAAAMEQAIDLGMTRVLTSGGAPTAADGTAQIAALNRQAGGRIEVMAGSGVTSANVQEILKQTAVPAVHASCSQVIPAAGAIQALGFGMQRVTDPAKVKHLRATLDRHTGLR